VLKVFRISSSSTILSQQECSSPSFGATSGRNFFSMAEHAQRTSSCACAISKGSPPPSPDGAKWDKMREGTFNHLPIGLQRSSRLHKQRRVPRSPHLLHLTIKILLLFLNIRIVAQHLQGAKNVSADLLSRTKAVTTDWCLSKKEFRRISKRCVPSRWTCSLTRRTLN